jgi:eukaryotic-like serine/threonine-protein kinase
VTPLPDKSSRHSRGFAEQPAELPEEIILGDSPELHLDSKGSTLQLVRHGSSAAAVVITEDKTIISKRQKGDSNSPAIHVGPLDSRTALEGETLEHFKLEEFVGGGGMGAVYRGIDTRLNRVVAIKILSRDQADTETVRRFRNEAQSAARLDHANITRVYYIGEDKGWNFIVFEFIEGINLRELVNTRGVLSLSDALAYTMQIAEALHHAQSRDVVHRDVKPSNLLITSEGAVKLVDMGLARLHLVNDQSDDLTASGVTLGTFDYISPEQARDPRVADVRSDIYSLGCTLYFMLVGRPPFPEGTALQKLLNHSSDTPPDVRLFRPDIPDEIVTLLTRMMAKKPEQRFQKPTELITSIVQISQRHDFNFDPGSTMRFIQPTAEIQAGIIWWQALLPLAIAFGILLLVTLWPTNDNKPQSQLAEKGNVPLTLTTDPIPQKPSETVENSAASAEKNQQQSNNTETKNKIEAAPTLVPEELEKTASTEPMTKPMPEVVETSTPESVPVIMVEKKVIVQLNGTNGNVTDDSQIIVTSLADAIQYAANHAEIKQIELAFTGQHVVADTLQFASPQVTIRPTIGEHPELVFRLAESKPQVAINVATGANVVFDNLRFVLEPQGESAVGIRKGFDSSIELADCVVTVKPSTNASAEFTLFECLPGDETVMEAEAEQESTELPSGRLSIRRSIIRGSATLCALPEDYPLRLSVSESFVACGKHLLQTAGMSRKPQWMDRIRLDLHRSTIYTRGGLALIGSQIEQLFRMEVRMNVNACLIVTDRGQPLVESRGGEVGEKSRVSFTGSDNFYPQTLNFYRRVLLQDGEETALDLPRGDIPDWAVDLNAEHGDLANALPEKSVAEFIPADITLKSSQDSSAGCSIALLPFLEIQPVAPISTPAPMTASETNLPTGVTMPSTVTPPIMEEKISP